jgi:hypothetical protein
VVIALVLDGLEAPGEFGPVGLHRQRLREDADAVSKIAGGGCE